MGFSPPDSHSLLNKYKNIECSEEEWYPSINTHQVYLVSNHLWCATPSPHPSFPHPCHAAEVDKRSKISPGFNLPFYIYVTSLARKGMMINYEPTDSADRNEMGYHVISFCTNITSVWLHNYCSGTLIVIGTLSLCVSAQAGNLLEMIKWIASLIRVLIQGSVKLLSCAVLIPSLYKLLGSSNIWQEVHVQHRLGGNSWEEREWVTGSRMWKDYSCMWPEK